MREAFANDIKLTLEFLLAEAVSGRYEELLYSRLCRKRRRSNVSTDRIGWDFAPANERLTFFFYYVVNCRAADFTLGIDLRQEDVAYSILSGGRESYAKRLRGDVAEEAVGQGHENTRTVARVSLKSAASAMIHARIQMVGVEHNLVARFTFNIGDEANTAGVLLLGRVVETLLGREAER